MEDSKSVELDELLSKELAAYQELASTLSVICGDAIRAACKEVVNTIRRRGKIFIAGNGGSASQADHIAAEFVGRFKVERQPYPAYSLATSMASLTAIANDYSYEEVFARQLRAHGQSGDLVIALTTSGKSKNIICLLEEACKLGISNIALAGSNSSKMELLGSITVSVPSVETARIQEVQLLIGHLFALVGEEELRVR